MATGKKAKKSDWKTNPMPKKKVKLRVDRSFSQREFAKIRLGHVPESMEDHWFAYVEGNMLNIHRSWSGDCWYQARIVQEGKHYRLKEAWARNAENKEKSAAFLQYLIDAMLLGKKARTKPSGS